MNKLAEPGLELVAKPRRTTVGCWIAAVAVLAVCVFVATALRGTTEGGGVFHAADQYTMVGLGILAAAGIMMFARPRVWISDKGIRIRNVIGAYDLPWEVVKSVSFPKGASWAMLELADDDVVSIMAIQAVDRDHALAAVKRVRAGLARHRGE